MIKITYTEEEEMIMQMTEEEFDLKLLEICENTPMRYILSVEGVYEALAEEFNDYVIDSIISDKRRGL